MTQPKQAPNAVHLSLDLDRRQAAIRALLKDHDDVGQSFARIRLDVVHVIQSRDGVLDGLGDTLLDRFGACRGRP